MLGMAEVEEDEDEVGLVAAGDCDALTSVAGLVDVHTRIVGDRIARADAGRIRRRVIGRWGRRGLQQIVHRSHRGAHAAVGGAVGDVEVVPREVSALHEHDFVDVALAFPAEFGLENGLGEAAPTGE